MSDLIAIVGRPNVGKSALFNRIVGRRIAIVHDQPGVTRDRISAEAEWRGRPFTLVDTGGIGVVRGEKTGDAIAKAAFDQVQIAIEAARVVLFVVNVQEGLVPLDREVAKRLRNASKQVILVVNKADNTEAEAGTVDFAELGFETVLPVSAIHGRGLNALMNAAMKLLPSLGRAGAVPGSAGGSGDAVGLAEEYTTGGGTDSAPASSAPLKIAIVGRPNVGKSSIVNALTQSDRVIVSEVPGTTRDSVDVPFEVETEGTRQKYLLIDTAGIRKKRRIDNSIEFFSVKRAEDSIERSDLVVFVMDAEMGITEQDKKIADLVVEGQKACVLVVNKWDLVEDQIRAARKKQKHRGKTSTQHQSVSGGASLAEFGRWVQDKMFFLDYAPVIFTSATSGFHLDQLLEAIRFVAAQLQQKIPTALLNRVLNDAIELRQPISNLGHRLKFFYATQVKLAPPTFVLFVNRDELFSAQYTKHLTVRMRQAFGYEGCPIVLIPKARPQKIESIRTRNS